jgi:hypothetical protein
MDPDPDPGSRKSYWSDGSGLESGSATLLRGQLPFLFKVFDAELDLDQKKLAKTTTWEGSSSSRFLLLKLRNRQPVTTCTIM